MNSSLRQIVLPLTLVLHCMSGGLGAAQTMLRVDMEGETTITARPAKNLATGENEQRILLHQSGLDISTTADTGTLYSVYRSSEHYKGQYSLGFRIDREQRPPGVSEKSKIEINVSRHDDYRLDQRFGGRYILTNGSTRFLGFALKLDEHRYEPPTRWLLHFQIWQCCSNETQPPLTFQVLPNAPTEPGDIRFVLLKRNDAYLDRGLRSDNGERLPFADGKDFIDLHKGRWYRFIVLLKPNPDANSSGQAGHNTGQVELWIDGQLALRHIGAWGYTAQPGRGITNRYGVKLGVYRAAQNTTQQFFIDNIRWGSTLESGNPDNP